MTPVITRATRSVLRWAPSRFGVALIAAAICWSLATVVSLASAQPSTLSQTVSAQQPKPQPAQPGAKPAPKPNPFAQPLEEEEEEEQAPAARPAAPGQTPPPAAKKNPFAEEEEPEAKPGTVGQTPPTGAPKNPFALEEDEELEAPRARSFTYTGTAKCSRCHMKELKAYREGPHGRQWDERSPAAEMGCETCHGPGQAHDDEPAEKELVLRPFGRMAPREVNEFCQTCHSTSNHVDWLGSQHAARNVSCVDCHSIHKYQTEKAQLKGASITATCAPCHRDKAAKIQRASHMPLREGKMECTSCHSPHGSPSVRMLKAGNTVNESCLSCHAEKRGPFLWDHAAVRESCTSCHDPHGSTNDRMLVARPPMLCQRCHVVSRHPSTIYDGLALQNNNNRLVGRSCLHCHPNIHGTNHPSGQFFER